VVQQRSNKEIQRRMEEAPMHEAKQIDPMAAATAAATEAMPGVVRVPGWELFPWLRHGFSTRAGGISTIYCAPAVAADSEVTAVADAGDLNLGWTANDAPEFVAENRRRFTKAVWPARVRLRWFRRRAGRSARGMA
jgi:hypothetical protein